MKTTKVTFEVHYRRRENARRVSVKKFDTHEEAWNYASARPSGNVQIYQVTLTETLVDAWTRS